MPPQQFVHPDEIRAKFSSAMSDMYQTEVLYIAHYYGSLRTRIHKRWCKIRNLPVICSKLGKLNA